MTTLPEPEVTIAGGIPIHRQIREQIRAHILAGRFRPGEQLPTVRTVAVELAVNPQAVERAYAALEREGFVSTIDGSGAIAVMPVASSNSARLNRLCSRFLSSAQKQGFTRDDLIGALAKLAD